MCMKVCLGWSGGTLWSSELDLAEHLARLCSRLAHLTSLSNFSEAFVAEGTHVLSHLTGILHVMRATFRLEKMLNKHMMDRMLRWSHVCGQIYCTVIQTLVHETFKKMKVYFEMHYTKTSV